MDYFINMMITVIYIYISLITISNLKFTKKEIVTMIFVTQLITFPLSIYFSFLIIIPLNIITIFFLYKKSKKTFINIVVSLTSTIIAVISDYIVSFIRIFIIGMNFNIIFQDHIIFLMCFLADCIVIFIISKLLRSFLNKKIEMYKIEINSKFVFLIISALLLTLIIFYANIILGSKDGFTNEIIELNGILFFIYFILLLIIAYILIKNIIKELEFKNKKIQFENLQEYTSNLEKLYTEMREFRHDYINILSSIIGYIENKFILITKLFP